jgi:hypothetical protein
MNTEGYDEAPTFGATQSQTTVAQTDAQRGHSDNIVSDNTFDAQLLTAATGTVEYIGYVSRANDKWWA